MVGKSITGQTLHWIGAQFCVCMFLDPRDMYLNMLKLCRNDPKNERTKEEQRERPCCGIHLQFSKCTVWPRNKPRMLIEVKLIWRQMFFGSFFCCFFNFYRNILPVKYVHKSAGTISCIFWHHFKYVIRWPEKLSEKNFKTTGTWSFLGIKGTVFLGPYFHIFTTAHSSSYVTKTIPLQFWVLTKDRLSMGITYAFCLTSPLLCLHLLILNTWFYDFNYGWFVLRPQISNSPLLSLPFHRHHPLLVSWNPLPLRLSAPLLHPPLPQMKPETRFSMTSRFSKTRTQVFDIPLKNKKRQNQPWISGSHPQKKYFS